MNVKIKNGLSVFKRARDAKPTTASGSTTLGNREPAVVSPRARRAIPGRSPLVKAPGGRSLTQSEVAELFGQMAIAFVREFFPQQLNIRRLVRLAAV